MNTCNNYFKKIDLNLLSILNINYDMCNSDVKIINLLG